MTVNVNPPPPPPAAGPGNSGGSDEDKKKDEEKFRQQAQVYIGEAQKSSAFAENASTQAAND